MVVAFADEQTLTPALLDCLLHHAQIVQIAGESYRLKDKRKGGQIRPKNWLGAQGGSVLHRR